MFEFFLNKIFFFKTLKVKITFLRMWLFAFLYWSLLFVIDPHILHLHGFWIGVALSVNLNGVSSSIMVPVTCICLPWPPLSDPFSGLFIDTGFLRCFPPLCCPLLPLYCPSLIPPKLWLPVRAFVLVHVCPCVAGCVSSYEIYDVHLVFCRL